MKRFYAGTAKFPHFVYKIYDSLGCLLYVGITFDIRTRMKAHERTSDWYPAHVFVELSKHESRAEAAAEETRVIKTECPIFNVHQKSPVNFQTLS